MKERGKEGWSDNYLAALAGALGMPEPASLLTHNPFDESASWSLIDSLTTENRKKAIEYIQLLKDSEERQDRAA